MKNSKVVKEERNWGLVFIASILIVIGLAIIYLAVTNIGHFGWWSLLIGIGGLTTTTVGIMSIVTNDPTWILLDLIIPS